MTEEQEGTGKQEGTEEQVQKNDTTTDDGAGKETPEKVTFDAAQQAHIDKLISERLARQKTKIEADQKKAADKAKADAEQKKLEDQQEYKKLADKHAARVAELEPLTEEVERYKEAIDVLLEVARADVPEHIKPLLDKLDPVDQLAYLAENAEALTKQPPPSIDADKKGKSKGKGAELTDTDIELWCAKYNIKPKNVTPETREQIALALGR